MSFQEIVRLYTEYIATDYEKKLHAGELLAGAARLLLQADTERPDNPSALQWQYLARKIAGDLLRQCRDMGYSRQYECDPAIPEYTRLAYELAYRYCERKPDRRLLPFLSSMIYYERFRGETKLLGELNDIYEQSIGLEKKYSEMLVMTVESVSRFDIWGF